jgi:hypothetical protein
MLLLLRIGPIAAATGLLLLLHFAAEITAAVAAIGPRAIATDAIGPKQITATEAVIRLHDGGVWARVPTADSERGSHSVARFPARAAIATNLAQRRKAARRRVSESRANAQPPA